jgi:hypothetical protein
MFAAYAGMKVSVSGGPIHGPHEQVLQLFIRPWKGDAEAWTVYRHEAGGHKDGKIVFKKWNREADKVRFRALGDKEAPQDWRRTPNVVERQIPLAGRWLSGLERKIGALSIPPIAGPVRRLSRSTCFRFRLWRSRQESEFSWHPTPPKAWRPLANLFNSLLVTFRQHADGKPLAPLRHLFE